MDNMFSRQYESEKRINEGYYDSLRVRLKEFEEGLFEGEDKSESRKVLGAMLFDSLLVFTASDDVVIKFDDLGMLDEMIGITVKVAGHLSDYVEGGFIDDVAEGFNDRKAACFDNSGRNSFDVNQVRESVIEQNTEDTTDNIGFLFCNSAGGLMQSEDTASISYCLGVLMAVSDNLSESSVSEIKGRLVADKKETIMLKSMGKKT